MSEDTLQLVGAVHESDFEHLHGSRVTPLDMSAFNGQHATLVTETTEWMREVTAWYGLQERNIQHEVRRHLGNITSNLELATDGHIDDQFLRWLCRELNDVMPAAERMELAALPTDLGE
eukprot:Skav205340  [mRNA]  locus=scaffold3444:510124:510480:- [translate_table: standard]